MKRLAGIKDYLQRGVVLIVLIGMVIFFSASNPGFIEISNIITILRQASVVGVMSVGLTFVLLTGGIDLSTAAVVSFTGILCGVLTVNMGIPTVLACVISIMMCMIIGMINGIVIHLTHMEPLIATMGMMNVVKGITYVLNGGMPVYNIPETIRNIGQGVWFGIPIPIFVWAAVVAFAMFVLKKTQLGRKIYAIGANAEAARLSGINSFRIRVFAYASCSLLVSVAGIVLMGRLNSGQVQAGGTLDMDTLTACVVGGVSTSGGSGKVEGTLLGVLVMAVLANGMGVIGVDSYWQLCFKGLLMLMAVGTDCVQRMNANKVKMVVK